MRTRHIEGRTVTDEPMMPDNAGHSAVPKVQAMAVVGISGAGEGTQADLLVRHLAVVDPERRVLRADQGALLRARKAARRAGPAHHSNHGRRQAGAKFCRHQPAGRIREQ